LFLLPPALALRHLPPFPTRRSSDLRKFPLGDAGRHGRDPARPSIGAPERIHYGAIVAAVTGGLNDDVALKPEVIPQAPELHLRRDRKSTRLNSSHLGISYAVFCLKK